VAYQWKLNLTQTHVLLELALNAEAVERAVLDNAYGTHSSICWRLKVPSPLVQEQTVETFRLWLEKVAADDFGLYNPNQEVK
jgi:hypothetical protein